jgi:cbb3-type cytochrome oxidase subunit 1
MVQEKPSSIRRFLSYGVKPNRSNVYKRTIVLISGISFKCKFVPRILKDKNKKIKKNKFFVVFEILANVLLTLINWLLKPKCMLKHCFLVFEKHNMIF